ncbi:MAG: hypothetical protein FJ303_07195 [Planctomycetes bacterium]|nr:hypothetical protein [Planctomycetota bacterium]
MTNDAKLGLVLGVAIVLVTGLVFFRTEPADAKTASNPAAAEKCAAKQGLPADPPSVPEPPSEPRPAS